MEYNLDGLRNGIEKLELSAEPEKIEQLTDFYELLIEKNKVMNLTAITDFDEVVLKHYIDSLAITQVVQIEKYPSILDLGTGAGFPGIPLKIFFPENTFVLADSLNKRLLFLNEVIEKLGLKKIETVHGRAEELARKKEHRESFDLVVSRAVANLSSLSEYCIPFVRVGGLFVSYKAAGASDEILAAKKAIHLLGGDLQETRELTLPDSDLERLFAIIAKTKPTPGRYPRKPGTPSKEPLN